MKWLFLAVFSALMLYCEWYEPKPPMPNFRPPVHGARSRIIMYGGGNIGIGSGCNKEAK
jgi:hypothetical protein